MQHEPSIQIQRAVDFFKQAGLTRIVQSLRAKYLERGAISGQIIVHESSTEERRNLASFLGKTPYPETVIRLKLRDIDNALQHSGFSCTLPELLAAFFPGDPLITRPAQRQAQQEHQEHFQNSLHALNEAQPALSRARQWLSSGQHGLLWLHSRYKNNDTTEQERQLTYIRSVANALNQLPSTTQPERLAIFSQRTSGDPHNLDSTNPAGRLFLQALSDLSSRTDSTREQGRSQDLELYQEVGLLVDTISSFVAVFSLREALTLSGTIDPLIQTAGDRILLLTLRQLLSWQSITSFRNTIYIMENPQVFEEIVTKLEAMPATHLHPTLVCTAGWPSVAALTLLDMLLQSNTSTRFLYNGDFDLKGLQIAAYFLTHYPKCCELWYLNSITYTIALQAGGLPASEHDLRQLDTLPESFIPLVKQLQTQRVWAYQEGIANLLLDDCALPERSVHS